MRASRLPERFQQLLARSGTSVTVEEPRVYYTGQGAQPEVLWGAFKQLLEEEADEPFRYDGELRRVRHEHLQFEASAVGNLELRFDRHFTYTEWGDIVGFSVWMTFEDSGASSALATVVNADRDGPAAVAAWVADVERSAAFRETAQREPASFGFALDAVG